VDVVDPYLGDDKAFDDTIAHLEVACSDLLKGL
jgi:hypothetical protein